MQLKSDLEGLQSQLSTLRSQASQSEEGLRSAQQQVSSLKSQVGSSLDVWGRPVFLVFHQCEAPSYILFLERASASFESCCEERAYLGLGGKLNR